MFQKTVERSGSFYPTDLSPSEKNTPNDLLSGRLEFLTFKINAFDISNVGEEKKKIDSA